MSRKAPPGPPPKRWERFRRLLAYYLECVQEDQQQGARLALDAQGREYVPLRLPTEWNQLEGTAAEPRVGPAELQLLSRTRLRGQTRQLFYGYPVLASWEPKEEGKACAAFLLPLFQQPVEPQIHAGEVRLRLLPDWPRVNREALRRLFGSTEEQNEILERLGLLDPSNDLPAVRIADAVRRLKQLDDVRLPELEPLDPDTVSTGKWPDGEQTGLLNRAVLFAAEPSRYTAGLERELKDLASAPDAQLDRTALAPLFSDGWRPAAATKRKLLIEVRGLNAEQRQACELGLSEPLTVVTGPPGTGKSQVVINILANAFLDASSTVFSSRNRKAVSVVEERLNALVRAPILLRLGSHDGLAARLTQALNELLSTASHPLGALVGPLHDAYAKDVERRNNLEEQLGAMVRSRNEVDQLDQALDDWRRRFSDDELSRLVALRSVPDAAPFAEAARLIERHLDKKSARFGALVNGIRRSYDLRTAAQLLAGAVELPSIACPREQLSRHSLDAWLTYARGLRDAALAAAAVARYERALNALLALGSLDALSAEWDQVRHGIWNRGKGILEITRASIGGLLDGPTRTAAGQLRAIAQRLQDESPTSRAGWQLRKQIRDLLPKVKRFMPAWAVTNLSAPGALPFDAALFDLAVIDEASQCDIPSAIPLLFRARQSVIIGDPQQLRHISTLAPACEVQIAAKHGLTAVEDQPFTFVNNSLFDLAAATSGSRIVSLCDHFRSHDDIVGFSNQHWYGGRLRVLTDQCSLNLPKDERPGVRWTQVSSRVFRPDGGGAIAPEEADRVVEEVTCLLSRADFKGTVGVVSPFRAQANRIRERLWHRVTPDVLQRVELVAETAHGFQGDERDVMVFSPCVGAPMPQGARRFLAKTANLFNVAVTRARAQLHVVGDLGGCELSGIPHVVAFAQYVAKLGRASEQRDPSVGFFERPLEDALRAAGLTPIPQYAEGPYRLDFAIIEDGLKIAIEVDGEHFHRELDGSRCYQDIVRDGYLRNRGWTVLRFWAVEVRDRLDACVERVQKTVCSPRGPLPPRPRTTLVT